MAVRHDWSATILGAALASLEAEERDRWAGRGGPGDADRPDGSDQGPDRGVGFDAPLLHRLR